MKELRYKNNFGDYSNKPESFTTVRRSGLDGS